MSSLSLLTLTGWNGYTGTNGIFTIAINNKKPKCRDIALKSAKGTTALREVSLFKNIFSSPTNTGTTTTDAFISPNSNASSLVTFMETASILAGDSKDVDKIRKSLVFQDKEIYDAVMKRNKIKIIENDKDVTPINLGKTSVLSEISELIDFNSSHHSGSSFWGLGEDNIIRPLFSASQQQLHVRSSFVDDINFSLHSSNMDDITSQIAASVGSMDELDRADSVADAPPIVEPEEFIVQDKKLPFIKITLSVTDEIVLYESNSLTVPRDSEEAKLVEADNEAYDYLTVGKGKNRRTSDAEAQTVNILFKSRAVNTESIKKETVGTFVSNYDMFDTYTDLDTITHSLDTLDKQNKIVVTTYKRDGMEDVDEMLSKSENFQLSSMVLQRLLAGNIYRERQKRFRNMIMPNPLDLNLKYLYRFETLWSYKQVETIGKAVSCVSWCQSNSDLLAVSYGIYDFVSFSDRMVGYVCIWSIKNPKNPERRYKYEVPVTAVAFSKQTPQLLAVGLFNGSVEILDVTDECDAVVGKSERLTSPGYEPVWQIKWIQVEPFEELLTISEDGYVMKYTLTNGPFLLGFCQFKLDRIDREVEGLKIEKKKGLVLQADRHPQALTLAIHPLKSDIFFVGTDEGCIHKCSTFYPNQNAGIVQVHRGSVFAMEFSPFSPKIFLTCGSDWFIRIWIEDIFEPVLELSNGFEPIRSAQWCPINSTIIACTTKTSVQLWNIRKSVLKPASTHKFGAGNIPLTICRFTSCGRSIVVGDTEGTTHVCALEDMPLPPHYQYDELQAAIYTGLLINPDLLRQIKRLGFMGYDDNKKE